MIKQEEYINLYKNNILYKIILIALIILNNTSIHSQTPNISWSYDLYDNAFGNPSAADLDKDGKKEIVFSTYRNDGFLYVLNSEDGSLLWKYNIGDCSDAAPLIFDFDEDTDLEIVVHSSCLPYMFCFNGADGNLEWKITTRGTDSPPSVAKIYAECNPLIFDGDFRGYLSCFNGKDGSLVWEKLVEDGYFIQTAPVLSYIDSDDTLDIVVATYNLDSLCSIYAFKSTDGSLIWKSDTKTNSIYHAPTIANIDEDSELEVIVSDFQGYLYCFNSSNGKLKWEFNIPNCKNSLSPTTIADLENDGEYEIIYFCDNYLNIISPLGKLKWNFKMINGTSAFRGGITTDINNDNILDIIFGNYMGELTAVSGKDGSLIWSMDFVDIYGKNLDVSSGLLASDFNEDGLLDIFVIGGWANSDYKNNYGRAYMINSNSIGGPDWLMFRNNEYRNSFINNKYNSVAEVKIKSLDISPNPASDYIEISVFSNNNDLDNIDNLAIDKTDNSLIKIYNIYGECIVSESGYQINGRYRIDIKDLQTGLFFIRFANYSNKFMVLR